MKLQDIIFGTPASQEELDRAAICRQEKQVRLLKQTAAGCLLCLTLNIPGPIKTFPLALDAFDEGLSEILSCLSSDSLLHSEQSKPVTGPEAYLLLKQSQDTGLMCRRLKKRMSDIEEHHPLGRLFNIDVFGIDGQRLSRSELGLPPRSCLICGEPAVSCIQGKQHSKELLSWRTAQLLNDYFRGKAADLAASCAVRALLYEVSSTPKPGLVDRNNSGSHKDMDFFTFLDSSAALIPWFRDFFCMGWDHAGEPDALLFSRLRFAGQKAEQQMFAATGGVNTHKGLIFSFAVLCAALGRVHTSHIRPLPAHMVIDSCRRLGACSLADFQAKKVRLPEQDKSEAAGKNAPGPVQDRNGAAGENTPGPVQTAGERCHEHYGISGARGEAAAGFPSARRLGLPELKRRLSEGYSLNDAAILALLSMISAVDDTNMIHRGGYQAAQDSKKEARRLLSNLTKENYKKSLEALDADYIKKNLSPGGCADLLAVSLMLCFLEQSGMTAPFDES